MEGRIRPPLLPSTPAGRSVTITSDRLEEFVRAELGFFAERKDRPLQPLRLREILAASSATEKVAQLLHEELPVRFARRVRHIERIPGWQTIPELVALHKMHTKSFRELRLADPSADLATYPRVISRIRQRHKRIGPLFAEALQRMDIALHGGAASTTSVSDGELPGVSEISSLSNLDHHGWPAEAARLDRRSVEKWAEAFLSSRVSTEMQMAHYAACLGASAGAADGSSSTKIGIIDAQCDPFAICQQAIAQVQDGLYPCLVEAENPSGNIRFCQAPRYLFYIMMELLHNSARATAEIAQEDPYELETRPVKVSVCANELQVVIRVSDRGGGMKPSSSGEMWSFVSNAGVNSAPFDHAEYEDEDVPSSCPVASAKAPALPWGVFGGDITRSPLSGRGIGLPLSRLYAKYLGGSLEVINMPGLGVDAYLFLTRIDPMETGP